jgi:hypothetical protein
MMDERKGTSEREKATSVLTGWVDVQDRFHPSKFVSKKTRISGRFVTLFFELAGRFSLQNIGEGEQCYLKQKISPPLAVVRFLSFLEARSR